MEVALAGTLLERRASDDDAPPINVPVVQGPSLPPIGVGPHPVRADFETLPEVTPETGLPGWALAAFSALGGGFLRFPIGDRRCKRTRAGWRPRSRSTSRCSRRAAGGWLLFTIDL